MESGSNLGLNNDNDPYTLGSTSYGNNVRTIQDTVAANIPLCGQNLRSLLQNTGHTWCSYREDTGLANSSGADFNSVGGTLTNNVVAPTLRTVPLTSFSGTSNSYTNPYNGSSYYNFACKHEGALFFTATNGSTSTAANTTTANPFCSNYVALQELEADLAAGTCADYNVITPDQYNDMGLALPNGFTYHGTHYTGDLAQIAQGDNFLSIVIPQIMASSDYKNGGRDLHRHRPD